MTKKNSLYQLRSLRYNLLRPEKTLIVPRTPEGRGRGKFHVDIEVLTKTLLWGQAVIGVTTYYDDTTKKTPGPTV